MTVRSGRATKTGMATLGLNTTRGDAACGENGLSALPNRRTDARAAIDQAIQYAVAIDAANTYVTARFASGARVHVTFVGNPS